MTWLRGTCSGSAAGLTRTEIFERSGRAIDELPPEKVMDVEDLVDAALNRQDRGEAVTVPSLEDSALWNNFEQQRKALPPYLSLRKPAILYNQSSNGCSSIEKAEASFRLLDAFTAKKTVRLLT